MLPLQFDDIGPGDILRLVEDKASEQRTLEYKQQLSIDSTEQKAEFLADISSFANAVGGDIVFGISDERDENGKATGIPDKVVPLQIANPSAIRARVVQIIESGIDPRLPLVQVKSVDIPEVGTVIVVRVGKSWIAPHMVSYANRTRFFSRNGTGKVQLDVRQIGHAFAEQRSLGERLSAWKANRIAKALAGDGPITMQGPQILYHFVSAATLAQDGYCLPRVFDYRNWGPAFRLISLTPLNIRYNADGFLILSLQKPEVGESYLQIFRDGSLEFGDAYLFRSYGNESVASGDFETKIVQTFDGALSLLKQLEVAEPVFVTLTLVGVKGMTMRVPNTHWRGESAPFDREVILSPDMLIHNLSEGTPYSSTLLPIINNIWQGAGLEKTPYTDQSGAWKPRAY